MAIKDKIFLLMMQRGCILRNQECKEFTGFEIWDVTDRAGTGLHILEYTGRK